mmetsp:Transcript_17878/g.26134  ORF Transcript_17878/g.26134 Transcript_17878/m.26134 type:complete len:272 (+) Transcript_17878:82-897(+)|eukprot:CAMPEP_0197233526 /NCGR_PEP_ID=MMETSP1429-20130617/1567_1 /TAXON_ID=49237 /ORGANISM="Chaetoceros  sp., Strain UNC1202" /LENGTH=271 /DNA_ID=CAMNT_0042691785 /DNA_START=82 /DNA_END=897 /DNA_ORIENTATION=-
MSTIKFLNPQSSECHELQKDFKALEGRIDAQMSQLREEKNALLARKEKLLLDGQNLLGTQNDCDETRSCSDISQETKHDSDMSRDVEMDSVIIKDHDMKDQIKVWLTSVHKETEPMLLYRASRDGWDATLFHEHSDGKGATIVLVKTTEGYIFGGFADVAWSAPLSVFGNYKSSKDSFLFSLKCHAGLPPVKMNIKEGKCQHATRHYIDYGPAFGQGYDLIIGSHANANGNANSSVGNTYELPADTVDPHFLTGTHKFDVAEYEVFQVLRG